MSLPSTTASRRRGLGIASTTLVLFLVVASANALVPRELIAQLMYATPEIGTSQYRGPAVGARAGAQLVGGLDLVGQALVFFPDNEASADAGVDIERSLWHASLNALYAFDRSRALAPYVGVGARYYRSSLGIVVDDLRARSRIDGVMLNLIGGVRLTRLPASPFVEYRGGGEGGWVLTAGATLWRRGGT